MGSNHPNLPRAIIVYTNKDLFSPANKAAYFKHWGAEGYTYEQCEVAWQQMKAEADSINAKAAEDRDFNDRYSAKQQADYNRTLTKAQTQYKTTTRVAPPAAPGPVDWYRGDTHERMKAAIDKFHIRSKLITDALGNTCYIIQSDMIRLKVPILDDVGSQLQIARDKLNDPYILNLRTKKSDDDEYSYNLSISAMRAKAAGYFMSEQHAVWAMGASARTNCFVPPEFFTELEVNGGTAGNGPDVLDGGGVGQPLSTIAMAHDADWMIGRLFQAGPLRRLYMFGEYRDGRLIKGEPSRYKDLSKTSLKALGSAGLFSAIEVLALAFEPLSSTPSQKVVRGQVDDFINSVAHLYRGLGSAFLNQAETGWEVRYHKDWASFNSTIENTVGLPVIGIIAGETAKYLFKDRHPLLPIDNGPNDVRTHNFKRAPGFPKPKNAR